MQLSQVGNDANMARPVSFGGAGVAFTRQVANVAFGGQVVLTESAWTTVQDHIPGRAQVPPLAIKQLPLIPFPIAIGAKPLICCPMFGSCCFRCVRCTVCKMAMSLLSPCRLTPRLYCLMCISTRR